VKGPALVRIPYARAEDAAVTDKRPQRTANSATPSYVWSEHD
jgi:hypothetical protein